MEGVWGPGNRMCVVANDGNGNDVVYTMDLAPFKVVKSEHCSTCCKVKLSNHEEKKKEENLVVGECLLGRSHVHDHNNVLKPLFESSCHGRTFCSLDNSTIYHYKERVNRYYGSGLEGVVQGFQLVEDGDKGLIMHEEEKLDCLTASYYRYHPKMLALERKVYVFGGIVEDTEFGCPWSEVFDPVTGEWDTFTALPPAPSLNQDFRDEYCVISYWSNVVVISPREACVFQYDADSPSGWNRLAENFNLSSCREPVLVRSTIYWIDNEIHAYDLEKDMHFKGNFSSYEISNLIENCSTDHFRLLHIGGNAEDVFCLVRPDFVGFMIHFTRLRISKDHNTRKLRTSIISCSSKATQEVRYISKVMLLDIFDEEANKTKPETESGQMSNKAASNTDAIGVSFLGRSNKRSVDSENSPSPKEGGSDTKAIRSQKTTNLSRKSLSSKEDSKSKAIGYPDLKRCSSKRVDPEKSVPSK